MRVKKVVALALTTVTLLGLIGCGNTSGNSAQSSISDIQTSEGGNTEVITEATTVKLTPEEEIKNASLNSGELLIDGTIFQTGGYETFEEFYEKYIDSWDIYLDASRTLMTKDYLDVNQKYSDGATRFLYLRKNGEYGGYLKLVLLFPKDEGTCKTRDMIVCSIEDAVIDAYPMGINESFLKNNGYDEEKIDALLTSLGAISDTTLEKTCKFGFRKYLSKLKEDGRGAT